MAKSRRRAKKRAPEKNAKPKSPKAAEERHALEPEDRDAGPEEALRLLDKESFDLIISDHYMPSMNGIEFFQALRARPDWKDIPFLMTTSEGRKHKIAEAIGARVRIYITKPVDEENLQTKINRLMNT